MILCFKILELLFLQFLFLNFVIEKLNDNTDLVISEIYLGKPLSFRGD